MSLNEKFDNRALRQGENVEQFLRAEDWNAVIKHVRGYINVQEPPYNAVGDGVTDDTVAFAAAVAAGKHIIIPAGTYVGSIVITGSGYLVEGSGTGTTKILPPASATKGIDIHGVSGYATDNSVRNLTIDMTNMTDLSSRIGLSLAYTFNNTFERVNVVGFGSNKLSLQTACAGVGQGVYTSEFRSCDFGSTLGTIKLTGNSTSDATTTLTFTGCSFAHADISNSTSITFLQPIIQGSLDAFLLSNVIGLTVLGGDVEGTGTYLNIGASVSLLQSAGNFVGKTYSSGTASSHFFADAGSVTANTIGSPTVTIGSTEGITGTRIALQGSGWTQKMRVGPSWAGDAIGVSANVLATGAAAGTLDDTGTAGLMLEVDAGNQQLTLKHASAGANPRTLTSIFSVSTTAMGTGTLFIEGQEIADPAAPAANNGRLYFRDNGAGKTQLVALFPTGAVQVIATEP